MFRIAASCAAVTALTIMLMGGAVIWIFTVSSQRILDNHLIAYADVIVSRVRVEGAELSLKDATGLNDLPRYWQLSENGRPQLRSKNLPHPMPMLPENISESQRIEWKSPSGQDILAVQATFVFPKGRRVTLTSGLDRAVAEAYREQEKEELVKPLLRVLVAGAAVIILATMLLLLLALRPLARIRTGLGAVRDGRAQRIEGEYPAEIADLADDINRLLDFNAGALARHREYAANLAHSLKTPLTVAANETDIGAVREKLRGLTAVIDRSLARAHAAGGGHVLGARTPVLPVLQDIAESFGKLYGKQVAVDVAPGIIFAGDRADLFEIAGSIIENACKFSKTRVGIRCDAGAIVVEDDGAGIPEAMRGHVLARGARLDESASGTGIGLAVAQDVAALYGGGLQLETSALGGIKVLIKLPLSG